MRRKGISRWLLAEQGMVRTELTAGVAHRIAGGETPLAAWRMESAVTIARLDRLTGIAGARLIEIERGTIVASPDELRAIADALRVAPHLLGPR